MQTEIVATGWTCLLGMSQYLCFKCLPFYVDLWLAFSLPLYDEHSCALGIAVMTYLDELCTRDDPTLESTWSEMKIKSQSWIEYCDFPGSLDDALHLWDAVSWSSKICRRRVNYGLLCKQVYKGVKVAGKDVKNGGMWDEVNEWLSSRRWHFRGLTSQDEPPNKWRYLIGNRDLSSRTNGSLFSHVLLWPTRSGSMAVYK